MLDPKITVNADKQFFYAEASLILGLPVPSHQSLFVFGKSPEIRKQNL